MEKLDYDIVVVGGGPAGSSAAYAAAGAGMRVALVEKEKSVAHTVRTSGVTWIDQISQYGIPHDCYNPIRNFVFHSPNNRVSIGDGRFHSAVLDVRKTYRWLASQATSAGAELFVNTSVTSAITESGKVTGVRAIRDGSETEFIGRVIIDASGFGSVVAKSMKLAAPWRRFGAGAEYEARVDNVSEDTWWLMVGQKYSPAGYAWIFPVGGDVVRIGVGIGKPDSATDPAARLDELVKNREGPISDLGRIEPFEFHCGLIPNDGLVRRTIYDNLILVGDAAGQANPLVLEGIRYAIRFGRLAGTVSAGAVSRDNTLRSGLAEYESICRSEIAKKIASARRVQDRWLKSSDRDWDRELDVIGQLKPDEFLDFIKAEFGLSSILHLAANHPKLAVRQLFSLVRDAARP